ncbi:MAG: hypothetical protein M1817_001829 [Caeruleum heppii]|nr:MAG: hypothetical protein M1817_001829 [Caeruleum heppii]
MKSLFLLLFGALAVPIRHGHALTISPASLSAQDPADTQTTGAELLARANNDPTSRTVTIISDLDFTEVEIDHLTGEKVFFMHSALEFSGTAQDGPLRVEVVTNPDWERDRLYAVRAQDFGVENTGRPIGKSGPLNRQRYIDPIGETTLKNSDIADAKTAKGLIADVWGVDSDYRSGMANVNNCNTFVQKLGDALKLSLPSAVSERFERANRFAQLQGRILTEADTILYDRLPQVAGLPEGSKWRVAFDIEDPENPIKLSDDFPGKPQGPAYADRARPRLTVAPLPDIDQESRPLPSPFASREVAASVCVRGLGRRTCATSDRSAIKVVMARTKGILATVQLVAEPLAKAAGVASLIAAPVFIILDLVDGDWIGAGIGAVGLALGVVAGMAIAGPVGWIVGGLISALFAILPGLFGKKRKNPPPLDDKTQILQWAVFGDKDHTGNEECRKRGDPNCTALYGPGVLSSIFKWDNFDAIAFLVQYNAGYAMTLPEIAEAFYVMRPDVTEDGENDHIATITCKDAGSNRDPWGPDEDKGEVWGDVLFCSQPQFALRRDLITVPGVDRTADQVHARIIPDNPGGDCRLVNDAANALTVPAYNLTLTGQPVAIACNLSSTQPVDDPVTPSGDPSDVSSGSAPLSISAGNGSSDGQSGHFQAAPPPTPFAQSLNASSAVCLSGPNQSLCLPSGGYTCQKGGLGFNSRKVTSMALPAGAAMIWSLPGNGGPRVAVPPILKTFNTNATEGDARFQKEMSRCPERFRVSVPGPSVSAVCLFTESEFKGDVACFGPGGQDLPEPVQRKAQSIKLFGSASAWIYAERYGDSGGAEVTSSIMDLKGEIYGHRESFNKKIVALWVRE